MLRVRRVHAEDIVSSLCRSDTHTSSRLPRYYSLHLVVTRAAHKTAIGQEIKKKARQGLTNIWYYDLLCYHMPCHAMPCHAMPCHAMPCHAMPCHAMPCHAMPCHAMPCHAMPCHAMPCHATPRHAMPCHAMPCHVMSCHTMPYHAMPCHIYAIPGHVLPDFVMAYFSNNRNDKNTTIDLDFSLPLSLIIYYTHVSVKVASLSANCMVMKLPVCLLIVWWWSC